MSVRRIRKKKTDNWFSDIIFTHNSTGFYLSLSFFKCIVIFPMGIMPFYPEGLHFTL